MSRLGKVLVSLSVHNSITLICRFDNKVEIGTERAESCACIGEGV